MGKKLDRNQQIEVLSRWCANQINSLTPQIGKDEDCEGGNKYARMATTELCQRLAQVGLGQFIADIDIDSRSTARQAVALLSKWAAELTALYETSEQNKRFEANESTHQASATGDPYRASDGNIYYVNLDEGWRLWHHSQAIDELRRLYRNVTDRDSWLLLISDDNLFQPVALRGMQQAFQDKRPIPTGRFMTTREAVNWLIEHRGPLPQDFDVNELKPQIEQTGSRGERITRPKLIRNLQWYIWYHDESAETHHSPARIRDRWNRENPNDRIDLDKSEGGRGVVKQGIKAAAKYLAEVGLSAAEALSRLESREKKTR